MVLIPYLFICESNHRDSATVKCCRWLVNLKRKFHQFLAVGEMKFTVKAKTFPDMLDMIMAKYPTK